MSIERWIYTLPLRLRSLFQSTRVEADLDEELRDHLDRQVEALVARGMAPEEAHVAARRAMGGLDQRKEECRDQRRIQPIDNLTRDVRHAFRAMRRSPGFTAVAVLSLALGIGANSAMFQLLAAIGLRSLPVARPHELAEVRIAGGNRGSGSPATATPS